MKRTTIVSLVISGVLAAACTQAIPPSKVEIAQGQSVLLSAVMKTPTPKTPMHAFTVAEHRLSGGYPQISLEELAKAPRPYFRSELAYLAFKRSFEIRLDRNFTDTEFAALLASKRVKTQACHLPSIRTAGIDDAGNIGWIDRACDVGENLIYLKVNNVWIVAAAMGCLNPIDGPIFSKPLIIEDAKLSPAPPQPEPPQWTKPDIVRPNLESDVGAPVNYKDAAAGSYGGTAPTDHNPGPKDFQTWN